MPVKKGDMVRLHFSGRLKNGKVFASTEGKEPLEFEAGVGEILPGIDEEVIGMEKNEEKEITLPPEKAFGKRKKELIRNVEKDRFKGKMVKVGEWITVQLPSGYTIPAHVTKVGEDKITLDLNHPLAGKEIIFKIRVVDFG
ncbi:peptidylprolyl isomerase [Candidatus Aerophobetes bacterium]|uniref:Peptidyl-prolyl cis-trans isomerase n=1 Tax=Aerophobetes bacterium TaxID=2030807 RepID=A0A662DKH3_UNCAE|nr:MAG: peptidylprolyl isomerase [Candidatus Aerophobetes bacterium]